MRIPQNQCRNDTYDSECITTPEFEQKFKNLGLFILTNRLRFDPQEYSSNPIIKESAITLVEMPKQATRLLMNVKQSQIER